MGKEPEVENSPETRQSGVTRPKGKASLEIRLVGVAGAEALSTLCVFLCRTNTKGSCFNFRMPPSLWPLENICSTVCLVALNQWSMIVTNRGAMQSSLRIGSSWFMVLRVLRDLVHGSFRTWTAVHYDGGTGQIKLRCLKQRGRRRGQGHTDP